MVHEVLRSVLLIKGGDRVENYEQLISSLFFSIFSTRRRAGSSSRTTRPSSRASEGLAAARFLNSEPRASVCQVGYQR